MMKKIVHIFFIRLLEWCSHLRPKFKPYEGFVWLIRLSKSRTELMGRENLPSYGGYVLAINHMGSVNIIFVVGTLFTIIKRPIYIVVQDRVYQKNIKLAIELFAFIPRTKTCLKEMISKLKESSVVGIAIAGERDKKKKGNKKCIDTEAMFAAVKKGAGYLSSQAPIVPVGFWAPDSSTFLEGLWGLIRVLFFEKIRIKVGKPIVFPHDPELNNGAALERSKEILKVILHLTDGLKPK